MVRPSDIPVSVRDDISIYFEPEEEIKKAICSVSGKIKAIGEVWLLLTDRSIFFHTREYSKDPVVALMSKKEIKEIDYFQKANELILTFVPEKKPANFTRLSFPVSKKAELEDFCDDIAELINFRLETPEGVKVYPKPETTAFEADKSAKEQVKAKKANDNAGNAKKTDSFASEKKTADSFSRSFSGNSNKPEVKIVSAQKSFQGSFSIKYALIATLISLIIGFIWYQFFKTLSSFKKSR
jgi:hypothetical protein